MESVTNIDYFFLDPKISSQKSIVFFPNFAVRKMKYAKKILTWLKLINISSSSHPSAE